LKEKLLLLDRGVFFMLLASLAFAFMGGFVKILSQSLPPLEITFFRNFIGVLIVGFTVLKIPLNQIGGKFWLLFFRGFIGFISLLAYFYIIAFIPLGEAVTYNKLSPIFVAIFAYIFLNEKLSKFAIFAVILGFIGITLIAKPDGFMLDKYSILGIFSGIGAALAYTSIRELRKFYDTRMIVLSFMSVGTIAPIILLIIGEFYTSSSNFDWIIAPFIMPTGITWFYIIGLGVFATFSQIYMTKAYSLAQGGIVGTISYTTIIFSVLVGMLLGDLFPTTTLLIGIGFIVLSGILVTKK